MTNPEASGGQPADDVLAQIDAVIRTMNGPAGEVGYVPGQPQPIQEGASVAVIMQPDGQIETTCVQFCVLSRNEGESASTELHALWLAIDDYAGQARDARARQRAVRMSDYPSMSGYIEARDKLEDEAAKLEERSAALNRIIDGLQPDMDRSDSRRSMVTVEGQDAALLYDALTTGFQRQVELENDDPVFRSAELARRMSAITYGARPTPGEGGPR